MIPPLDFYWEQMDGPQLKAIMQAIYNYFYSQLNSVLEYLDKIGIDTANSQHLTNIGAIAGIGRPTVELRDETLVLFSSLNSQGEPDHPVQNGFEGIWEATGQKVGGVFGDIDEIDYQKRQVNAELYRTILKTVLQSAGEVGGLVALDDIAYAMWNKDRSDESTTPTYTFTFVQEPSAAYDCTRGDVILRLGNNLDFNHPFETFAIIEALTSTSYYGIPKLVVRLGQTD